MMNLTHKAREVFINDRFATEVTGVTIDEVTEDCVRCSLALTDRHRNAMGAVMGGVMFTLADLAFAIAANIRCLADDKPLQWVSLSSSIQYLGQTSDNAITTETLCVKHGKTTCTYNISIKDKHEKRIAQVTTTGICIN